MAQAKQPKPNNNANKYYTRLIVYPKRRMALAVTLLIYFVLFTMLINKELRAATPWGVFALPLICSGLFWLLFPATEEWEYKAWQNTKQKQERLFFN